MDAWDDTSIGIYRSIGLTCITVGAWYRHPFVLTCQKLHIVQIMLSCNPQKFNHANKILQLLGSSLSRLYTVVCVCFMIYSVKHHSNQSIQYFQLFIPFLYSCTVQYQYCKHSVISFLGKICCTAMRSVVHTVHYRYSMHLLQGHLQTGDTEWWYSEQLWPNVSTIATSHSNKFCDVWIRIFDLGSTKFVPYSINVKCFVWVVTSKVLPDGCWKDDQTELCSHLVDLYYFHFTVERIITAQVNISKYCTGAKDMKFITWKVLLGLLKQFLKH